MKVKSILYAPEFGRAIKPLSKKYHTLKESVKQLEYDLTENPFLGDSYGDNIYKVRLSDPSKNTGKSGGFRVFYYHLTVDQYTNEIDLLFITIINKSEESTIKKSVISKLKDSILSKMKVF
jgi:mRNA-degrading endonuclease RelE of RelBE toxin-antitoxin system